MPLTRGIVRSYDSATQLASVELLEGPRALLPSVAIAASIPSRFRKAGQHVLVEDDPQQGPVILAPWRVVRQGNLQDYAYDETSRTFTLQSYVAYSGLQLSVTLVESSYILHLANVNQYGSTARSQSSYWRFNCSDTGASNALIAACTHASDRIPVALIQRSGPHAAGTITIDVECYCVNAGDTITARYSSNAYLAIPAE